MYFPYLRGKQFELLALREATDIMKIRRNSISPIIEPVKKDLSGLRRLLKELSVNDINFNIIINPSVGELVGEWKSIVEEIRTSLDSYDNYQVAFIVDNDSSWNFIENVEEYLERSNFRYSGITLIHEYQTGDISEKKIITDNAKYNIIDISNTSRRYYRNFPINTRVSLDDYFKSLPRNSDYRHKEDEQFTDEFRYYKEEGFVGFADYLTIGRGWSEGGFMPWAVVIHLTYSTSDSIRIRHFVCDSVEDPSDTAGKFSEALTKLVEWLSQKNCKTEATETFKELHLNNYFPGLGTVKKLSIKHHIETILNLI